MRKTERGVEMMPLNRGIAERRVNAVALNNSRLSVVTVQDNSSSQPRFREE